MNKSQVFKISSSYQLSGDQPKAVEKLLDGIYKNKRNQVLLGVTGSGKTFTMAKVKIASLAIVKTGGLLFSLVGLVASLLYFIPAALYCYHNERLRDELLDIFDDAMMFLFDIYQFDRNYGSNGYIINSNMTKFNKKLQLTK